MKTTKKVFALSTLLFGGMYGLNRLIASGVTPVTSSKNDQTFQWKDHKVNYTVKGQVSNPPLLLIHNLSPASSMQEWYRVDDMLAKHFHVFEIDLPGCGKSSKPNETYINYMYVQLVQDFIKYVIGKKTSICASAFSSSFTLMAARINPENIDKIIIINPTSVEELVAPVTKKSELKKQLFALPVIGTFLYNCKMCRSAIYDDYRYIYFYNEKNIPKKALDIFYYNAHCHYSAGRYLYGSIVGNYTNINIIHALPKITNELYLIGSRSCQSAIEEYKKYNPGIHESFVSNCRLLPQLEIPQTIAERLIRILA